MQYTIAVKSWHESQHLIRTLREKVFVLEWQIPSRLEFDENDACAHHLIAYDSDGNIVATARLTQSGEIGRIAVRPSHRSLSLYKAMFMQLLNVAKENHIDVVTVRCNLDAVSSMQQRGFQPQGRVFMEAGIPMQRLAIPQSNGLELPDIKQLH